MMRLSSFLTLVPLALGASLGVACSSGSGSSGGGGGTAGAGAVGGAGGAGAFAGMGVGGAGAVAGMAGAGGMMPTGLPVLGSGQHTADSVQIDVIATNADGLDVPKDVEFNPHRPNEVWIANPTQPSITIITDPGLPTQMASTRQGPGGNHFLAKVVALSFGEPGFMGTAHDEDQITQANTPADFMGPTLWLTDYNTFEGGHASHMDMLHNSPASGGIAWDSGNTYWVFDGMHSSITRYDFVTDHGPGGADHSDGVVARYAEGTVKKLPNVPSHIELDHTTGLLYIADTGNNRIAVLDTKSGQKGAPVGPNYDGTDQHMWDGAVINTLVDGSQNGLVAPSGITLHQGHVYVTDHATGQIHAFTLEGQPVDWVDTGVGQNAITGIDFDPNGNIYTTDSSGWQLLRISAKAPAGG